MNELGGYAFADLRVGMCATFAKTITEADIVLFAAVSGDNNAIHINEEFAAGTIFKGCIAHVMLSASVISAAIANTARSGQHLRVAKPAIQGACPGRRYCPCDRKFQRDDPVRFRVLLATVCTVGGLVVIRVRPWSHSLLPLPQIS
jgi:3-hydroxybutyryl-CoA dehydratase